MELEKTLERAIEWAQDNYPNSSQQQQSAFANSVVYLTTGWSGGYGGPSIREHLCSHALVGDGENILTRTDLGDITVSYPDGRLPRAGQWDFDRAVQFCCPICFGQLSRYALKIVVMEYCFDDDPQDLEQVRLWELEELSGLSQIRKTGKLRQKDWERFQYLKNKHR